MKSYRCQTCGNVYVMSADAWSWHRLVEHPRMGLPVHRPNPAYMVREPEWRRRSLAKDLTGSLR